MPDNEERKTDSAVNWALVVYVLFLVSPLIPVTALLGLLMAYINLNEAEPWLRTHHRYQLRTIVAVLAFAVLGGTVLWYVSATLGGVILAVTGLWLIARCIAGLIYLRGKGEHPNPSGWSFW